MHTTQRTQKVEASHPTKLGKSETKEENHLRRNSETQNLSKRYIDRSKYNAFLAQDKISTTR